MGGFHFTETPPEMTLVAAIAQENRLERGGINRCRHPDLWVLDYSITECAPVRTEKLASFLERPGGIAHLYPPGRRYYEAFREKGKYSSAYLIFAGENPELRRVTGNSAGFARILDPARTIQKLLVDAARAASRGSRGYRESFAFFCGVLDLLEHLPPPADNAADYLYDFGTFCARRNSLRDQVREYLEQHFREHITVGRIAQKFGVSESTLSHRYRREAGETLIDTLLRIRIEQSLPLLQNGAPLKWIASEVGFSSEFYYSKIFKRIYGSSPKKLIRIR